MINKRGNIFWGVTVALIVWVTGILFIPFLADDVDNSRVGIDCTNNSISSFAKVNCLYTDLAIPSLIWMIATISLGFIVGGITK